MTNKTALILEGGGSRAMFTCGILEFFLEQGIFFETVYGVSAGASFSTSYISKQKGRNLIVLRYLDKIRHTGLLKFFLTGGNYSWKNVFQELSDDVAPYDYDAMHRSPMNFIAGVSNCETGKAEYFSLNKCFKAEFHNILLASGSLPIASPIVKYDGKSYLDGGLSDSIPFVHALQQGARMPVVILTQPRGYRKSAVKGGFIFKWYYRKYPQVYKMLANRHTAYNASIAELEQLERDGKVFVIRPEATLGIGRSDWKAERTEKIFNEGYALAQKLIPQLKQWLDRV